MPLYVKPQNIRTDYHRIIRFTSLMIMDAHKRQNHIGLNGTIGLFRQTFWIPKIRQKVKMLLHSCASCRKVHRQPYVAPETPPTFYLYGCRFQWGDACKYNE